MSENELYLQAKQSLKKTDKIVDIWSHPIAKFMINIIPYLGSSIDSGIQAELDRFQRAKQEELFEIILEDGSITLEDVSDVTVIMQMKKCIDSINKLTTNKKVQYYAQLMKSAIKKENCDEDSFDEWLERLNTLSYREIELLVDLYHNQKEKIGCIKLEDKTERPHELEPIWDQFLEKECKKYNVSKDEITAQVMGLCRTGFCDQIVIKFIGCTRSIFFTNEYFVKFYDNVIGITDM